MLEKEHVLHLLPRYAYTSSLLYFFKCRGITAPPIVMSELLQSEAARKIKTQGGLVGDYEVVTLLLEALAQPQYRNGVIVDGFPRTQCQVECVELLYHKMMSEHKKFQDDPEKSMYDST